MRGEDKNMKEELSKEHEEAKRSRDAATNAILNEKSDKKVVLAGPGTGKTFLFGRLFASKVGASKLTLTFINALVEDLSLELRGISEVRTLHGYARSQFAEIDVKIFPALPKIIQEDGCAILDKDINFENKINEMDETDGYLDFYSNRRRYYGHFGHSDIILGLVRAFQNDPERIPSYSQIVVDEFQDFNKLEVTLIELLASKSPVLIAGDDDQALYGFKMARPDYIRQLHGEQRPEFVSLPLPFCSRSTRVIVDAVNDIISAATNHGFLTGRVAKRYEYFSSPEKDKESSSEPKLVHKRLEDAQISWFIAKEIDKIASERREKFDVLVMSSYLSQCKKIGCSLTKKGFNAVEYKGKENIGLSYFDGLSLLVDRRIGHKSNLGWRIASRFKLSDEVFAELLIASTVNNPSPFRKIIPSEIKKMIERDAITLRNLRDNEPIEPEELNVLMGNLELDEKEISAGYLRDKLPKRSSLERHIAGIRKIPITVATIQSSKGLSAEYVFITHFDQRYLPGKHGISDQSICNTLVALTRARKKVWLLSTTDESSVFLKWIDQGRISNG